MLNHVIIYLIHVLNSLWNWRQKSLSLFTVSLCQPWSVYPCNVDPCISYPYVIIHNGSGYMQTVQMVQIVQCLTSKLILDKGKRKNSTNVKCMMCWTMLPLDFLFERFPLLKSINVTPSSSLSSSLSSTSSSSSSSSSSSLSPSSSSSSSSSSLSSSISNTNLIL